MKFESVVKNRTTYLSEIHTELAVGYDFSGISFLGLMHNNQYIPHYKLPGTRSVVPHPIHREVTATSQVFELVRDLNSVVIGKSEMLPFMEKWFPDQVDYPLHAEGFVYLDETTSTEIDYSKIKLPIYYVCHNIHVKKIGQLLSLPLSVDKHFPQVTILRHFFGSLHTQLVDLTIQTMDFIEMTFNKDSPIYLSMAENARKRFDAYFENRQDAKLRETTYRMILNNQSTKDSMAPFIDPLITAVWGSSNGTRRGIVFAGANDARCWEAGVNIGEAI